jgi:hypothetical protein
MKILFQFTVVLALLLSYRLCAQAVKPNIAQSEIDNIIRYKMNESGIVD